MIRYGFYLDRIGHPQIGNLDSISKKSNFQLQYMKNGDRPDNPVKARNLFLVDPGTSPNSRNRQFMPRRITADSRTHEHFNKHVKGVSTT